MTPTGTCWSRRSHGSGPTRARRAGRLPEVWRDELSSWSFASRSVAQLVEIVRSSNASQLAYYLLLHVWIGVFGSFVLAMRLPSVLAMAGAAACVTLIVAEGIRPGDGVVYPYMPVRWQMIDYGVGYYLSRDLPVTLMPREVCVSRSAAAAGTLYPIVCRHPATCLAATPRVWVVGAGRTANPRRYLPANEVAALKPRYRVARTRHVSSLSIFLLTRT